MGAYNLGFNLFVVDILLINIYVPCTTFALYAKTFCIMVFLRLLDYLIHNWDCSYGILITHYLRFPPNFAQIVAIHFAQVRF